MARESTFAASRTIPSQQSRYKFTNKFNIDGKIFFEVRERLKFEARGDNRIYTVSQGDNLMNIAFRFFSGVRPAAAWWIVMDFNNIHDPTEPLEEGRRLTIPSAEFVDELMTVAPKNFRPVVREAS